ncbi:hypothetical protein IMZ48_09985 [Candidatus Bathyarchaeota archaeon]|nr:hypothetical protein [Candidatus Bathyarchaeota archaeon]
MVHMAMRCHGTTTRRSKKAPRDAFAMDMPIMAKACPMHSYFVASTTCAWLLISSMDWPKPYVPATWVKALKMTRNTCGSKEGTLVSA